MTVSTYKKYGFKCTECDHAFEAMMWVENGEPKGKNCPSCNSLQMPVVVDSTGARVMINFSGDWTKKLPADWSNFLQTFEKRHSKYGRTVNTHKRGVTEW